MNRQGSNVSGVEGTPMGGSACGKVILLGEHAVVYGVPALVVGIDQGASATVAGLGGEREASELVLRAGGALQTAGQFVARATDSTDVARAFASLIEAAGLAGAVRVEAHTNLPTAAGLGCSAAIGVAIARAILEWRRRSGLAGETPSAVSAGPSAEPTLEWAMAWERVFHGNPSGVDTAAAARGGCLLYRRTEGGGLIEPVTLGRSLPLAIAHTGHASSTRTMVDRVACLRAGQPEMVQRAFDRIASLVPVARRALEAGDLALVGQAMTENQALLEQLQVSTDETAQLCKSAREAGALGAKLTGSGGGGCVVAIAARDPEAIVARWQKDGFRAFSTWVHCAVNGPRLTATEANP